MFKGKGKQATRPQQAQIPVEALQTLTVVYLPDGRLVSVTASSMTGPEQVLSALAMLRGLTQQLEGVLVQGAKQPAAG